MDVYLGTDGMFVGSARLNRESADRKAREKTNTELAHRQRELSRRAAEVQGQISSLQEALADTEEQMRRLEDTADINEEAEYSGRASMREQRWADPTADGAQGR